MTAGHVILAVTLALAVGRELRARNARKRPAADEGDGAR